MNEKTINSKTVFEGNLLKIDVLDVELDSGGRSVREIVRHRGAAVILAQLPDGRFVFVRQFRKPAEKEMLELVAGTKEPGEAPSECAAREVREETGHDVKNLRELGVLYSSPGYSDEKAYAYYAELMPDRNDQNPDDDENLDVEYIEPERVEEMIENGEIEDAKTVAVWFLYKKKVNI
jgi:ADP-ribose pyrophosphatase